MRAENADIQTCDTVTIWSCEPVGQFAIRSAWIMGTGRVIAIDRLSERLTIDKDKASAEVINFEQANVHEALLAITRSRVLDCCIGQNQCCSILT